MNQVSDYIAKMLKLINTLKHLRDIGNTVIVVEHDEEIIRAADQIIDTGTLSGKMEEKLYFKEVLKNY